MTFRPTAAVALGAVLILAAVAAACNDPSTAIGGRLAALAKSRSAVSNAATAARASRAAAAPALLDEGRPREKEEMGADDKSLAVEGGFADSSAGSRAVAGGRPSDPGAGSAMVIRTGTASIEVRSIDTAVAQIRMLAGRSGGYVANSAFQGGPDQVRTATIEIKTPAPDFDRLLAGLTPIGHVEAVNVSAEDVGEQYVDVAARMANDHRLEARLLQLLDSRTGKLKDVLDVEQELARVREEIERYDGRLRYLREHAAVSTLAVTVHEPVPVLQQPGANPLLAATREAWHNFVGLIAAVIALSGVVLPIATVIALIWWIRRRRLVARGPAATAPAVAPAP